jgi:nitrite reductase/ring-hydroxylating ferredoxin subunit
LSFVEAALIYDMPEGTMKAVDIKGKEILLANVGGTLYAVSERCGHMNAPLARGVLNGKIVYLPSPLFPV